MCKRQKQKGRRTAFRPLLLTMNCNGTRDTVGRVVRAASQCVPDRNADIQLTEGSGARFKRQVWTSLLWLMTALWVQVNVLSDRGTSWPWNVLPRSSKEWYHALCPSSVNWKRAVSLMSDEDWMQHRHCLSSRGCCEATNWREGEAPYTFEQSDQS